MRGTTVPRVAINHDLVIDIQLSSTGLCTCGATAAARNGWNEHGVWGPQGEELHPVLTSRKEPLGRVRTLCDLHKETQGGEAVIPAHLSPAVLGHGPQDVATVAHCAGRNASSLLVILHYLLKNNSTFMAGVLQVPTPPEVPTAGCCKMPLSWGLTRGRWGV